MKIETLESTMDQIVKEALKLTIETNDCRFIDLFAPLGMSHSTAVSWIVEQEREGNKDNADTVRETVIYNATNFLKERFEDEGEVIDYGVDDL